MRLTAVLVTLAIAAAGQTLDDLRQNQEVQGFRTVALYVNDSDTPMGARFEHLKSGITLDLLRIESVPQTALWVHSFPTSPMGEPHTQEHLLLGYGNKGRNDASLRAMSLSQHTAFTMQLETVYEFNTAAGTDVFFRLFESALDSLLHPDYTDEEIRREVRNFGISQAPDNTLRLEEKGSVYNEMSSSMTQAVRLLNRASDRAIYGPRHPLAFNSGGEPDAIRLMRPSDIRKFHAANYFLRNMGAVVSLPKDTPLDQGLSRLNAILSQWEPADTRPASSRDSLPAPAPSPAQFTLVEYPNKNESQPSPVNLVWPAQLKLKRGDKLLAEIFFESFAGDATTNLYKLLIDTKSRRLDIGVKGLAADVSDEPGNRIVIRLFDVAAAHLNERSLQNARSVVLNELREIASWPEGSPDLLAFNDRVRSVLQNQRRYYAHFVNSPPQFGIRGQSQNWDIHLRNLESEGGFRRSVTLKGNLDRIEAMLASRKNIWTEQIRNWKLQDTPPKIIATKPSPALVVKEEADRKARTMAETGRLQQFYKSPTPQDALKRYKAEYDAKTAEIEKQQQTKAHKFIDNPPLTHDDPLRFEQRKLRGGIPLVASTFDSMTTGTAAIAFRIEGIPDQQLVFLALMPEFLSQAGVIQDGKPLPYERMAEAIRKEILALTSSFQVSARTDRAELVVRGSGNNSSESARAVEWMRLILEHPYWTSENLPRLRDVVDQRLAQLRRVMQGSEESWVRGVQESWRRQDNAAYLTAGSFLTQTYFAYRLRWMLRGSEDIAEIEKVKASTRAEWLTAIGQLPSDLAKDLRDLLTDIPDDALASDVPAICRQMRADLQFGPERALAALDDVRKLLLTANRARLYSVGSRTVQTAMLAPIDGLVGSLGSGPILPSTKRSVIASRLAQRDASASNPVFVGVLAPAMNGGVIINTVDSGTYADTGRQTLVDYLAGLEYAGGGRHSAFARTNSAGLAYSNGLAIGPRTGRLSYYAERTPEIPQTIRFVVDLIRSAKYDPSLAEYALAQAFISRAGASYESRAEAIAADFADGDTPELVAEFRRRLLALRKEPALPEELHHRLPIVVAKVLPGLGNPLRDVKSGAFLVIGPEKQMSAYAAYLESVEGADARLYRLYPRDFWITETADR